MEPDGNRNDQARQSALSKVDARNKAGTYKFVFPGEIENQNYMMLSVKEYTRQGAEFDRVGTTGRVFVFPIPGNLSVTSKMDYEQKALGNLGAFAAGRGDLEGSMNDISGAVSNKFGDLSKLFKGGMTSDNDVAGADIGAQQLGMGVLVGLGTYAGSKLGGLGIGALSGAAGGQKILEGLSLSEKIGLNPHMAVLFKGVGLRSFGFQYKFVARNQNESNTLKNIIRSLQYHMHPEFYAGNLSFKYPDEFEIQFSENRRGWLFELKKSVLTDMVVNYNGENMPLFYEDVGGPVSIDINMTFQETEIFTKKDYAEDFEVDTIGTDSIPRERLDGVISSLPQPGSDGSVDVNPTGGGPI